ncbi:Uncharacterised protein [Mycobacterium tuberculosis]|nr:Uncharacterised protein [Mycobacterium tuberculosis]
MPSLRSALAALSWLAGMKPIRLRKLPTGPIMIMSWLSV